MAFEGWLLKLEGRMFPMKFIAHSSYNATPDQQQDEDSYSDGYGELHRNVLPHKRTKIEWNTPEMLHLADKMEMQLYFPDRIAMTVEYWNDEKNEYTSGKFYVPDIKFPYYDTSENDIRYGSIRIALIEY
ncbi:DUF6711 family protein [Clostridium sp. AM58-1XD]|uniref:DUF6711 family protein n=1 Tax=Clostridium sp. AM58-1XD TaxID=2292307 RepID=UPI000E50F2F4|nr:DUF6711 family protein [Clostridium sp. AM58-1XD]RGY95162.1 hypothetical protein DXA13_19745 [Clostridium sp. AM58-1XD]